MDCSTRSLSFDQIQSADSLFQFVEGPFLEERKALDLLFSNYPPLPDPIQDYKNYFSKVVKYLNSNSKEEFEKAFLVAHFEESCNLNQQQSNALVSNLKSRNLSMVECRRIALFAQKIFSDHSHFDTPERVYLWPREEISAYFPISRQIQLQPNGTPYLAFNRVKAGDPLVGEGSFKKVKTSLNLLTADFVARICVKDSYEARSEFYVSKPISHKFFIKTLDEELVEYKHKIYYHQELFEGSLKKRIKAGPPLRMQDKFLVATTLIEGLLWLHDEKKMIHRDIKADNLLVITRDGSLLQCVIGDLSFVGRYEASDVKMRSCGSPLYIAPEYYASRYSPNYVGPSLDCWSAGIVLYQLFRNEVPEWAKEPRDPPWFVYSKFDDLMVYFKDGGLKKWVLPKPIDSNSFGHLVVGLLEQDPALRWTMKRAKVELDRLKTAHGLY